MYLETGQLVELTWAMVMTIVIFVAAYAAPFRASVSLLLLMIPFQPLVTNFGSANVAMTIVFAIALFLRRRLHYAPMLGPMLAVLAAYLVTVSQLPRGMQGVHSIEVFLLFSGFLVFILAYNLAREAESPRYISNLLVGLNVAAALYCVVQVFVAPGDTLTLFGGVSLNQTRGGGDARLVGPFGTPGITAAYLASMTVILMFEVLHAKGWRRRLLIALAALNVAMMIGTANRGSFLVLVASLPLFLYFFRAELGLARIIQISVASTVVLVGAAAVMTTYTNYGEMIGRLTETTTVRNGVPDTRARIWPETWAHILERPWLGYGPRIMTPEDRTDFRLHPEQLVTEYPHSLYLHLLLTVGVLGTACMLFFLCYALWRVWQGGQRGKFDSAYERGWVVTGTLVLLAFLVDEIKIEFLRNSTVDYAHFTFMLFGLFLGAADKARAAARSAAYAPRAARAIAPRPAMAAPPASTARHAARVVQARSQPSGVVPSRSAPSQ